jgi:hypothetical protein
MYPMSWINLAKLLLSQGKNIDEIQCALSNKYQCRPPYRQTIKRMLEPDIKEAQG